MRVSQFALGTGKLEASEAEAMLDLYLDAGGNLIDTAEAYGGGRSEELLGKFLENRRDDVVLISKCTRSTQTNPSPSRVGNHRKAMRQSVEGSLRRLRTDRIDFYLAHYDDRRTPIEEIMRGFDDLVSAGKILYPGLSNFPAWRMAEAAAVADCRGWAALAATEIHYNLLERDVEREILPFARERELGVLAYSPLARRALAKRPDLSAEEALAWVAAQSVFPILGASSAAQLAKNLKGTALQLAPDRLIHLSAANPVRLGYPHDLLAAVTA